MAVAGINKFYQRVTMFDRVVITSDHTKCHTLWLNINRKLFTS